METQDNGFLLVIDGVRKEKERLTAAKLFFLSFNPMVLSRLPALVSSSLGLRLASNLWSVSLWNRCLPRNQA